MRIGDDQLSTRHGQSPFRGVFPEFYIVAHYSDHQPFSNASSSGRVLASIISGWPTESEQRQSVLGVAV